MRKARESLLREAGVALSGVRSSHHVSVLIHCGSYAEVRLAPAIFRGPLKVAVIIVMLFLCDTHGPAYTTELKPYQGDVRATDFVLQDLHGSSHRLHDHQGKVVLINFWATWCPPCVQELPSLSRLQQHFYDRAVAIVTIDVGEPASQIRPFLKKTDSSELSVLMDMDGRVHKQWNIYVFPTSFLLDQSGSIRYAAVGALDWSDPSVINTINNLLSQEGSGGNL